MIALGPLGEHAWLARFADPPTAAAWAATLRDRRWPEVVSVVPAYHTVAVFVDEDGTDYDEFEGRLRTLEATANALPIGRRVDLPVLYDGADLPDVARLVGLTVAEVVEAHSGQDYQVCAIGFLPGFPYAGALPDALSGLPRRESPRTRVPAGSVAIVGRQTGVYPSESPGGWHLIGRTPLRIVDWEHGCFPLRAGDRLRFVPIGPEEFQARRGGLLQ